MTAFDRHVLILCIIVFILLVALTSIMFMYVYKQGIRLIRVGADDDKIKKEYDKKKSRKKYSLVINIILEVLLWAILIGILVFTLQAGARSGGKVTTPTLKSVNSSSMATKHPSNIYLDDGKMVGRVSINDLVVIEKLPPRDKIKLYDIVLYKNKSDGKFILHRVVKILPKGTIGNDATLYMTQGDAVPSWDSNPISYDDMVGIYRGKHVSNMGSFVRFMHSPAGYLCIALACIILIAMPIMDMLMNKEKTKRLREIGYMEE